MRPPHRPVAGAPAALAFCPMPPSASTAASQFRMRSALPSCGPWSINGLIDRWSGRMNRVVSATEARVHFGELLRRVVEDEEPVIVERGGKPQAVVLSLASYERLLAGDTLEQEDWWTALERVRNLIQAELGDRELPPVEDVIREMREERDAQLDAAIGDLRGRKPRRPSRRSSER